MTTTLNDVDVVRALGSRDARAAREAMERHIRCDVTLLIADSDRHATADREPSPGEPT